MRYTCLLSLVLPLAAAAQSFAPATTYSVGSTGSNPRGLVVADVNLDGYPDVVTANYGDAAAAVLLNRQTGTFAPAIAYALGSGNTPYAIAAADFNQDGYPDLATANYRGGSVSVLLNQRTGTFAASSAYALGGTRYPEAIAVADFNHDQYPDLVTANLGSGDVSVLLNQRNGTFQLVGSYPVTTASLNMSLAVGDLDQDGYADVAVATFTNAASTATVLHGQRDGTLAAADSYELGAGRQPYGLALGDVTRDGVADLVVGDLAGDQVLVLRGQVGGNLLLPGQAYATGTGSQPFGVGLADVNNDGFADVLTANLGTNSAGVLLSQGTGQLGGGSAYLAGPGGEPVWVVLGDANHDGRPDLLAANSASGTLGVLLGTSPLAARPTLAAGPPQASLFPNPAVGTASLRVTGLPEATTRAVKVALYDPAGRLVRELTLPVRQGEANGDLQAARLPAGLYLVRVSTSESPAATSGLPSLRLLLLP